MSPEPGPFSPAHELVLPDPAATERLGRWLARWVRPGSVLGFDGDLGAGKTSCVRGLLAGLGGDASHVCSPTFTLLHVYQARYELVHVDAWRLQGQDDLAALGFWEMVEQGVGVIEWSQRLGDWTSLVPGPWWHLEFRHAVQGRCVSVRHAGAVASYEAFQ